MFSHPISPKTNKVIFFDMYQTLVDTDIVNKDELTKNAFEKIFVSYLIHKGVAKPQADCFQILYNQELDNFYKTHDKETEHHDFIIILLHTFKQHFGIDVSRPEIEAMVYKFRKIGRGFAKLYPGVKEMLGTLSKNFTLIIASYTQASYSERELEELDIRKYFSNCVFSSDIGFKKKSDNFYKKCLEIAQSDPCNSIMVGDSLIDDIFMAKRNGMRTVWIVNPHTKNQKTPKIVPDASVPIDLIGTLPDVICGIL